MVGDSKSNRFKNRKVVFTDTVIFTIIFVVQACYQNYVCSLAMSITAGNPQKKSEQNVQCNVEEYQTNEKRNCAFPFVLKEQTNFGETIKTFHGCTTYRSVKYC